MIAFYFMIYCNMFLFWRLPCCGELGEVISKSLIKYRLSRETWKEGNVLFNNILNTFYLQLYGIGHMVKDHSDRDRKLIAATTWATLFRLAARVLLYALSHRQDITSLSLCYTSHGALAGTRNSFLGPPWVIDPTTLCTMSKHSTMELYLAPSRETGK